MRRDRRGGSPYDPTLSSVLFFLGVLALVISGPAFAQTAAGTFSTVSGQVQIQRAGVTIDATTISREFAAIYGDAPVCGVVTAVSKGVVSVIRFLMSSGCNAAYNTVSRPPKQ